MIAGKLIQPTDTDVQFNRIAEYKEFPDTGFSSEKISEYLDVLFFYDPRHKEQP